MLKWPKRSSAALASIANNIPSNNLMLLRTAPYATLAISRAPISPALAARTECWTRASSVSQLLDNQDRSADSWLANRPSELQQLDKWMWFKWLSYVEYVQSNA